MHLIALETATEACSVALYLDGEIIERHQIAPRRHAELVLPWIDELLAEAGIVRSQLDAVACGQGPGAFTGVRLAVAITQGLALALDRPAIGVSTLHALALPEMRVDEAGRPDRVISTQAGFHTDRHAMSAAGSEVQPQASRSLSAKRLLAAIDARMGEVYLAEYRVDAAQGWQRVGDERVLAPASFEPADGVDYIGVGTGFAADNGALIGAIGQGRVQFDASALPRASAVARLAIPALKRGEVSAPEHLQPAYLRNQVALTLQQQGKPVPKLPEGLL